MTTRKYVGRAWSPARTLSVLDLKGRLVEMLSHAERQGLSDHMELLAKLLARPTHRDPPELERTEALQHFDRLVEDAEALTTASEAMESDAASIYCSMEAEGIVEASQRARVAFEGRQVLAHGTGGRLGVPLPVPVRTGDGALTIGIGLDEAGVDRETQGDSRPGAGGQAGSFGGQPITDLNPPIRT